MTEINDCPPMEVKVLCPHRFSVQLPAKYADCGIGGIATEAKIPKDIKFKPLKESLLDPEFVTCGSANADRDAQLHLGFQALHAFEEAHQRLPRPWDVDDAMEVVERAKEKNALQAKPLKELDERILTLLSCVSSGSLCPMQSVIGSIAAQEVIKACSGKFTPIHQWFYFDAFECLPQEGAIPETNANTLRPKTAAATEAAVRMNPELCIVPHELKVGPETESMYDDRFFESLNGVLIELDNVEGRQYINRRCVHYCKPFLDSGTMGTKGSVQVVIPLMTESYSCSQDAPETPVPVCTIKYFPYRTEHTLEWARDEFEDLFKTSAGSAVKYLGDSRFLLDALKTRSLTEKVALLQELMTILVDERPRVFDDCVEFARLRFQEQYNTNIRQVLQVHPEGQLTIKGTPFWSGSRRCPHPIEFDPNNTLHMDYIVAAANLRAAMFGIAQNTDRAAITRMLEDVDVPVFEPHGNDKVAVSDDRSTSRDEKELVCDLLEELPAPKDLRDLTLEALELDMDNEFNFHADFIVAASNLRAANYNIQPADRLMSKLVVGKIIPAIVTTTSLVAGLACLEIYKLVQEHDRLELYKNSFVNLALPFFGFSEPVPPAWKKFRNQEFSFWNCIEIKGELTLAELLEYFRMQLDVEVTSVLEGTRTLYDTNAPPSRTLMKLAVSKFLERVFMAKIDRQTRTLALRITGKDTNSGAEVELPEVRYVLRK